MIGLIFIYKYRDEEVFEYFVSFMMRVNLKLVLFLVIGSDRDRVIKKGLSF